MIEAAKQTVAWSMDLWGRFSPRERAFVVLGSVVVIALVGFQFLLSPYLDRLKVLDRLILQKEREVLELNALRTEFLSAREKVRSAEARIVEASDGFSLFTHVEETAARQGVKDRIIFIRPQAAQLLSNYREVSVEVKFESMALAQVVGLLEAFQNSRGFVRIKRVELKTRYNDPERLDGTFLVATYEKTRES